MDRPTRRRFAQDGEGSTMITEAAAKRQASPDADLEAAGAVTDAAPGERVALNNWGEYLGVREPLWMQDTFRRLPRWRVRQ